MNRMYLLTLFIFSTHLADLFSQTKQSYFDLNGVYIYSSTKRNKKEYTKLSIQYFQEEREVTWPGSEGYSYRMILKEERFDNKKLKGLPTQTYLSLVSKIEKGGEGFVIQSSLLISDNSSLQYSTNLRFKVGIDNKGNLYFGKQNNIEKLNESFEFTDFDSFECLILNDLAAKSKYAKIDYDKDVWNAYLQTHPRILEYFGYKSKSICQILKENSFVEIGTFSTFVFKDSNQGYSDLLNKIESRVVNNTSLSSLFSEFPNLKRIRFYEDRSTPSKDAFIDIIKSENSFKVNYSEQFLNNLKDRYELHQRAEIRYAQQAKEEEELKVWQEAHKDSLEEAYYNSKGIPTFNPSGKLLDIDFNNDPLGDFIKQVYLGRRRDTRKKHVWVAMTLFKNGYLNNFSGNPDYQKLSYTFTRTKNGFQMENENFSVYIKDTFVKYFNDHFTSDMATVGSDITSKSIDKFFKKYSPYSIEYKQFMENLYRYTFDLAPAKSIDEIK